jgi:ABC-type glycerol-3-phosphate transport system substrate-binding protein
MMFINTDMYQEAGLDPNKPPTTFTELLEHAKKLTKYDASGKVIRSGYGVRYAGNQTGVADKFLPFLHAFGGLMVDPKFKKGSGYANSPAGVEALQFYGDMVNKYKVSSLNVGTPETAFGQKNAAIIFREAWLTGWLRDNAPTVHYKVYPIPTQKVVAGPSALFPWVDMVYKYSPNKKLAWEYLRFMWSKEHDLKRAMSQDIMPVWKANTETDYVKSRPDYTAIVETNMRKPGVSYFTPRLNEITSIYGDAVLDVIYGRKNAKTALDEAAVKLDQILSQ